MLITIARKEIRTALLDPKVIIALSVSCILVVTSVLVGAANYQQSIEAVTTQAAAEKNRLGNISDYREDVLVSGIRVYRTPSPLGMFAGGIEGDAAQRAVVNNFAHPEFDVSFFNSTPIAAAFGLLDLAFIVKVVFSLMAILFMYDVVSGEKDLGTLRLVLAQPVRRSVVLAGKAIGSYILLALTFLLPLLLGLLLQSFMFPGIAFSGEEWIRIAIITGMFLLYLGVFSGLGLLSSVLAKRSFSSLLIALFAWVLFLGLLPRSIVIISGMLHPVPSTEEVKKQYLAEYTEMDRLLGESIGELWGEYGRESNEKRPAKPAQETPAAMAEYRVKMQEFQRWGAERRKKVNDDSGLAYVEFTNRLMEKTREIMREYYRSVDRRNEIAFAIGRLASPVNAMAYGVTRIAETGVESADAVFRDNVDSFHSYFTAENAKYIEGNPVLAGYQGNPYEPLDLTALYPSEENLPSEPLDVAIAGTLPNAAALAFQMLLLIVMAFVVFNRYDAR